MEFIDGLTLVEYINFLKETNQKISKKFMIELFYQFVRGLKYMKNNKINYKDLNPNNILIYSKNKMKFIDFGLVKDLCLPIYNSKEKDKINIFNLSVSLDFDGSIFYSNKKFFNGEILLTIAKNIWDLNFDEKLNKNVILIKFIQLL